MSLLFERHVLAAIDEALGNGEGVVPFQIYLIQVDLIRLWGELLPDRPRHRFWCVLDEIVAPDFPRDQHCVVRARPGQMVDQGREFGWQDIEDALAVLKYKRIQEDNPRDLVGDLFRHLLNNRTPETMTYQDHVL